MLTFTLPGLAKTLVDVRIGCYLRDHVTHTILTIPAGSILEIAAINIDDETAWLRHPDMQDDAVFDMAEHEYRLFPLEDEEIFE